MWRNFLHFEPGLVLWWVFHEICYEAVTVVMGGVWKIKSHHPLCPLEIWIFPKIQGLFCFWYSSSEFSNTFRKSTTWLYYILCCKYRRQTIFSSVSNMARIHQQAATTHNCVNNILFKCRNFRNFTRSFLRSKRVGQGGTGLYINKRYN